MKDEPRDGKRTESEEVANETKEPSIKADLVHALTAPGVWAQPPVEAQPRKFVSPWSVHRATPKDGHASDLFGLHFVGRDLRDWSGCVSSRIMSFDPTTMCGTTKSGRVYELVSLPGHCSDGDYVLGHWAHFNRVEVEDVTEEFMRTYGLTRQGIMDTDHQKFMAAKTRC